MKNILLVWLLCSLYVASHAQGTIVWDKFVNQRPNVLQEIKTACQSKSGKFWVAVSEIDFDTSYGNMGTASALAFKDSTGDTLWYRNFHNDYPIEAEGWGVAHGPNGHFWVVIRYTWQHTVPAQGGIAVYEFDSLGQQLQHREFMQGCNNFHRVAVYSQPDGGLVIVGHINRTTLSNCTQNDLFTLRLDAAGNQVWQQIYELSGSQSMRTAGLYPGGKIAASYATSGSNQNRMAFIDMETGILLYTKAAPSGTGGGYVLRTWPLRDGSFIVGGSANPNLTVGYLARTDANFNIIWQRNDPLANIYGDMFSGETKDSCVIVLSNHEVMGFGIFLAKVRLSDGQELWRKYFAYSQQPAQYQPFPVGLEIGQNGDLYTLGSLTLPNITNGTDFYMSRQTGVADFLQPSDYCSDSLRANFTGTWQNDTLRLHSISNSGMVHQDSVDCQWLIGGNTVSLDTAFQQTISMQANPEGINVTLVITNFWGCKDTLIARVLPNGTITGNRPVNTHGGAYLKNAYPNPSAQNVSIGYTLPAKTENAVLRVYEMATGRTVAERHLSALDNEVKFNVSTWATGVYAYQLYVNGAPVAVKKMTVSR
jgi:hypothetical protein